jgi:hypothetical protein
MEVKCIVSGFKGTVVSRHEYLNGCTRFGVEPKAVGGKASEVAFIDHQQLVITKARTEATKIAPKGTGGPMPAPRSMPAPPR